MPVGRSIGLGATAGAVGTTALHAATYLDMVVRGRPASDVPERSVQAITDRLGVEIPASSDDGQGSARVEGLGALLGIVTGCVVGAAYGVVQPHLPPTLRTAIAGAGLAAAATVTTSIPNRALGVSDPLRWSAVGWAADVVPHLCYGFATAAAYDRLR